MYSASLTSLDSSPANALGASLGRGLLDASSGIDEHADGEFEDVTAATDATPSVPTGNVSRLRKYSHLEPSIGSGLLLSIECLVGSL